MTTPAVSAAVPPREDNLESREEAAPSFDPPPDAALTLRESTGRRVLFGVLLFFVAGLYLAALLSHWYPANPNVDQNGYLVGGKLLALTGNYGFIPDNPHAFVGLMWNLGPDAKTYYPKYPLGLPWLYAAGFALFGETRGPFVAHLVSPLCATLAVVGMYVLSRPYVGAFGAVLAALLLGLSPVTFGLAVNPNSHASTLCFVVWGMTMLLSWWRSGGAWRALVAGFLLGYALTIRYTEGLLLLPMGIAALYRLLGAPRKARRPAFLQGILLLAAWAVPVGTMLAFNFHYFGSPTGYDSTRESTGFAWEYFVANWDLMLRELNDKALALLFPLGVGGLAVMTAVKRGWQLSLLLAAWVVPGTLIYTAYYWAPEGNSLGYARFILTVLPGLVLSAVWLVVRVGHALAAHDRGRHGEACRWNWGPIATGCVFALSLAAMASTDADTSIPDSRANGIAEVSGEKLQWAIAHPGPPTSAHASKSNPPVSTAYPATARASTTRTGSALAPLEFADQKTLNHLQFVTDAQCYSPDNFSRGTISRLGDVAKFDEPHPWQPQRAAAIYALLKDKTDAEMVAEQNTLMDDALAHGSRVFFLGPVSQLNAQQRRFLSPKKYDIRTLDQWQEPGDLRANRWQRSKTKAPIWAGRKVATLSAIGAT